MIDADAPTSKHSIPVIDRLMDVLEELERHSEGLSITQLTENLVLPRTTIYRILNSLQRHEVVRRDGDGTYHLGRRLLTLASHVASRAGGEFDLAVVAQPYLDRLAADLGEGVKLSVLEREEVLVLAAARGKREYALTVTPGQRVPVHVGAASKLLLAYLPLAEQQARLVAPLMAYTPKTITDPRRLKSELTRIKRLGWAQDRGENAPSIQAFAAPVFDPDGKMLAAVSVPFLAGTAPARMEEVRLATIATAKVITQAMG